jgi:hypothetical protein
MHVASKYIQSKKAEMKMCTTVILPVFAYRCKTFSFELSKGHAFKVF